MNVVILILDSGGTIRQFKNIQNETKKSESLRFPIFLPSYMRTVYSIIQYVLQLFIISYCLSRCFTSLSLGLLFPARVICGAHCSAYERKRNLVLFSFRSSRWSESLRNQSHMWANMQFLWVCVSASVHTKSPYFGQAKRKFKIFPSYNTRLLRIMTK